MRQKKMVNTGKTLGSRTPEKVIQNAHFNEASRMVILRPEQSGLQEVLDRILDKGVVVDAEVRIGLGCVDLLGIRATIILSSFKTARQIGLAFPEGTNTNTPAWQDLLSKQPCPVCGMESRTKDLREQGCPWCGWNYRPNVR